jgi:hypothetical protein
MLWLKSCPKCRGDLHSDADVFGTFVACVQCGRQLTGAEETLLLRTRRMPTAVREVIDSRRRAAAGSR